MICSKLKIEAEPLEKAPMAGEIGDKIFNNISKKAWSMWLEHQTMLINEHRLSMINPEHRKFILNEMNNFLFGNGSDKPAGFVAPYI